MSAQFYIIGTIAASAITLGSTGSPLMAIGTLGLGAMATKEQIEAEHRQYRTQLGVAPEPPQITATAATETTAAATTVIENNPVIEFNPQFNPQISVNNPAPADAPQTAQPPARTAEPVDDDLEMPMQFRTDFSRPMAESLKQPTAQDPIEERIHWLQCKLKEDGASVLLKLVGATPLRVIGPQRSGKSTFVKTLALLRMLFLEGHSVEAWSPDDETKDGGQWPQCFELYGLKDGKPDYQGIAHRMQAMGARVDAGQRGNRTLVMDEFGSYGLSNIDHDLIKDTVKLAMMRAAKNQELAVLILHGHTTEFLGGVVGLQGMLQQYRTIWLDVKEDQLGRTSPGNTFRLSKGDNFQTIPRPSWLTPGFLLGLFPELTLADTPVVETEAEIEAGIEAGIEAAEAPSQPLEITAQQRGEILRLFRAGETSEAAIAADATPQQKGKILQAFREGQDSEAALIGFVWPGVTPSADEYPDCRSILRDVLSDAGLLREWDSRLEAKRIPRK